MSLSRFELSLHSHVHGGRSGPLLQGAITNITRRNTPPPKTSKVCFSLYEAFSLSGVLASLLNPLMQAGPMLPRVASTGPAVDVTVLGGGSKGV